MACFVSALKSFNLSNSVIASNTWRNEKKKGMNDESRSIIIIADHLMVFGNSYTGNELLKLLL